MAGLALLKTQNWLDDHFSGCRTIIQSRHKEKMGGICMQKERILFCGRLKDLFNTWERADWYGLH